MHSPENILHGLLRQYLFELHEYTGPSIVLTSWPCNDAGLQNLNDPQWDSAEGFKWMNISKEGFLIMLLVQWGDVRGGTLCRHMVALESSVYAGVCAIIPAAITATSTSEKSFWTLFVLVDVSPQFLSELSDARLTVAAEDASDDDSQLKALNLEIFAVRCYLQYISRIDL